MTSQEALEKANCHRRLRSGLKDDIKHGRASAKAYILAPPEFIRTMKVYDLLMSQRHWGKTRVNKLLRDAGVPATKEIEGLTERQRDALVRLLPW